MIFAFFRGVQNHQDLFSQKMDELLHQVQPAIGWLGMMMQLLVKIQNIKPPRNMMGKNLRTLQKLYHLLLGEYLGHHSVLNIPSG